MMRLKIGQKLLLLFLVVSVAPLFLVGSYWYRSAQSTLRTEATSRQSLLTSSAADRVNQYVGDKVNLLIIHSQTVSVQTFDLPQAQDDIATLIKQDRDIQEVSLADSSGKERLAINRNGLRADLHNIAQSDAFRASTFLSGKEYISAVSFDENQQPYITLGIPLVNFEKGQSLSSLSTAEEGVIRSPQSIRGAFIVTISLGNLWQSVLAQKLGSNGYAYVVDSQGILIAYPDSNFLATHHDMSTNPQVAAFLKSPMGSEMPTITTSEKGEKVLSSHHVVSRTNWAVIAEEPVSSIFASATHVAQIGGVISAGIILLTVFLSIVFSRRITKPIKALASGAERISGGDLAARISSKRSDELGSLAHSFNGMADSLATMVLHAQSESNKLNVILDNIGEGVVAVDSTRSIAVSNVAAAVLAGELPKNIIGKPLGDVFHLVKDNEPFTPDLDNVRVYKDVVLNAEGGKVHYVNLLINQITNDPSGIQTIITIIDKTSERELENMKLDFVSMAAHELRTPMTAIRGYLDLILHKGTEWDADTKDSLLHIQASSRQLVGLINNLLNVSKIERGALTINLDQVNWSQLVQNAVSDQLFSAGSKSIALTYDGPYEAKYILADEISIAEVINNLISNAINYTPFGGTIIVHMEDTPEGILTSVKDTGIGIPAASMEHLFTKFYRVHGGLASGSGGTGLGLFISKSIVELHGGSISIDSVEGEGSTFSLLLPHFDSAKHDEIIKNRPVKLNRSHGWVTKNITR